MRATEAMDPYRAVRVTVGPDGLPAAIEVYEDWAQRLRPEGIGRAVWQAWEVAQLHQLRSWAAEPFDEPTDVLPVAKHAGDAQPGPTGRRRSLDELLPEALAAVGERGDATRATRPSGTGSAARGRLELVLSAAGLQSCTADPEWVSQRTGDELTEALAFALAEAREELAAAGGGTLARLLNEGLAHRNQSRRT
jgi:hypothetical protein